MKNIFYTFFFCIILCSINIFVIYTSNNILPKVSAGIIDDSLDQYQLLWSHGITVAQPDILAQRFQPSKNVLTRIELLIHKASETSDNLTISIRSSLNGTDLTSITVTSDKIPLKRSWIEFDVPDINLSITDSYYIIFAPEGNSMMYFWWGYDNHNLDSYTKGEAWLYTDGKWVDDGFLIKDFSFKTYGYHHSLPPATPSCPVGPIEGLSWHDYYYETSTTDPDGDQVRYGWDWNGDDIVDEWTGLYPSGVSVNISHSWDAAGTYYIQVKAMDNLSAQSVFSESLRVVIVDVDNDPPDKPARPVGPSLGRVGVSYSFGTVTADPNGDRIYYLFDWDDGTDSGWVGPFASGQACNVSHIWSSKGSFQVKVKARDEAGLESVWSDPLPISMPKNLSNILLEYIFRLLNHKSFNWNI